MIAARRYASAADVGEIPRAARVVSDREGGFIALDPVRRGELVVRAAISPPLRVKRDRELRRMGIWIFLAFDVVLLLLELAALGVAWARL